MEDKHQQPTASDQLNPGQNDQFGNDVEIKRNEGISDQGNEWSDQEEIHEKGNVLGEKAEKYIRDSADIEDLPEQDDEKAADDQLSTQDAAAGKVQDDDDGEDADEVIESEDEFVPGFDLGRNKVQ